MKNTIDKNKPIKIIYENDEWETKVSGDAVTFTRKLTPTEIEKLFGTTKIGVFDCSGMSDEEINKIINELNSIPN